MNDGGDASRGIRLPDVLLLAYLALLLLGTLTPSDAPPLHEAEQIPPLCVICGARAAADAAVNIALFAPLGFLLGRRWGAVRTVVAAATLSAAIEVAQLWIPGRYPVLSDLTFNTAGAAAGLLLVRSRAWWWRPPAEWGRTLALGGATVLAAGLALGGWMLGPRVPDGSLYGQWTPRFGHLETYRGRVLDARVGEIPVPRGRLAESGALREALERGAAVRVRFVAGPAPPGLAPVFSIHDDRRRLALLIGADGEDLVVTLGRRADAARLDRPALRLRDALGGAFPGDTVEVRVQRTGPGTHRLAVSRVPETPGGERSGMRGVGPGRTWSLLYFVEGWSRWTLDVVDLAWLAVLGLPLGWWAPGARTVAGSTAIYLGALVAVPLVVPLAPASWPEYAAAVAGVLIGAGAARKLRGAVPRSAPVSRSAPAP